MEVKVSNVSKLASKDTLKTLFSMLGTVLVFEHYPNTLVRDGSYECDIVYANIREAKRAVRLSGTQLGDRIFTVTLVFNPTRFRLSRPAEQLRQYESLCQTALLWELPRADPIELTTLCGGTAVVTEVIPLGTKEALVEFHDRPSMMLAFERLKVATLDGSRAKVEEAWRRVDPDYFERRKAVTSNNENKSRERSGERHRSSRDRYDDDRRRSSRDERGERDERERKSNRRSNRSRSRSKSRERSRSRERHHRSYRR